MSSIKTDSMVSTLRSNANNAAVIPEKLSKQQQNAAILAASEKVALQSNNNTLSLLYKTALDGINDALEPTLGKNATKKSMTQVLIPRPRPRPNALSVLPPACLISINNRNHQKIA
ncbi:hypothetical protein [Alishewanella sp. HL-SH05]|uniref:hypothetical protein n=1 Tax=Alishewanella sp. HL-SH05 TaxID=3461145 RepID=UPI0040431AD5